MKNPQPGVIYDSYNGNFRTTLYHYKYEGMNYFKLAVSNGFSDYILYSDRITIRNNAFVTVYITKKNNLYQLDVIT